MEENKSEVMKSMGGTSGMDKRNRGAGKEGRKKERERKNSSTHCCCKQYSVCTN